MMTKVYFTDLSADSKENNLLNKLKELFRRAGDGIEYDKEDLVAVKLHFGEKGIDTYLRPVRIAPIVEAVKEAGGKPFLCDSNTLYKGSRSNAVDHHRTAQENGWLRPVVDAPVVIADGLHGNEFYTQKIDGKHFDEVKIGAAFYQADAIIGVSHFKGHMMSGFGGTLKNLGMGCASRAGKLMMHYNVHPEVDSEDCIGCGKCAIWCPADAIEVGEHAVIDSEKCIGCGECRIVCPEGAIKVKDSSTNVELCEKISEFAHGSMVDKYDKSLFFNFIMDVTPECDCPPWRQAPLVPDIGVVASKDPVAVEQAALDLVTEAEGIKAEAGVDKFGAEHDIDGAVQIEHAVKMGMGKKEYELVDISG